MHSQKHSQTKIAMNLPDGYIGPEFGLGHMARKAVGGKALLVKTAWGAKSLAVDFRPPSSIGSTGPTFSKMINTVKLVSTNFRTSLTRRSPLTSRSSSFTRCASAVVTPSRTPVSTSWRRTQPGEIPIEKHRLNSGISTVQILRVSSNPGRFTQYAVEGATCKFSDTPAGAYGASGKFHYKSSGNEMIACNNQTFGDPNEDILKACYYK